ncbi:hypothetical protein pmac_cds_427 [Pandoravirus macleodensis]|uniref:Uncharacterized protein n=1 Tax=Pandoravirus macleodensis TaxID=2107707 RepID=A0A2U7UFG5_9VIRU|nr:hypothetical protein pmac_cds_427 [Pandoravirus macleodensis]AVK77115.1 hypothetical protein pmac_cds_427 [Pandoravirus macleodensis]
MNLLNLYLLCVLICCAWYGPWFCLLALLIYSMRVCVVILLQALNWRLFHGGGEIEHW